MSDYKAILFRLLCFCCSILGQLDDVYGSDVCNYILKVRQQPTALHMPIWTNAKIDGLTCTWNLEATAGSSVQIMFEKIHMYGSDTLLVRDGNLERMYSGGSLPKTPYVSTTNRVLVLALVSDQRSTFELTYRETLKIRRSGDASKAIPLESCPQGIHIYHEMMGYSTVNESEVLCAKGQRCMITKNFKLEEGGNILTAATCISSQLCDFLACSGVTKLVPGELPHLDLSQCETKCCSGGDSCKEAMLIHDQYDEKAFDNPTCRRKDKSKVEDGRQCRKRCKRDSDCKGKNKKCLCDDWCGQSCYNPKSLCKFPLVKAPMTAKFYGEDYKKIQYDCINGYFLEGNRIRKCRSDKKWSGKTPNCKRGCRKPKNTTPHSLALVTRDGYEVGAIVRYVCEYDYFIVGNSSTVCQLDSTWSRTSFRCVYNPCGAPPNVLDPTISNNPPIIDTSRGGIVQAHYTCAEGYENIEEDDYTYCQKDDVWSPLQLDCQRVEESNCPEPIIFPHINVLPIDKKSVSFFCDDGYNVIGSKVLYCRENGIWSGNFPFCYGCPRPLAPENGYLTYSSLNNSMNVNFSCNDGYTLLGYKSVKCVDTAWETNFPLCFRLKRGCDIIQSQLQNDVKLELENLFPVLLYSPGDKAKLTCFGKELKTIKCLHNFNWSYDYKKLKCRRQTTAASPVTVGKVRKCKRLIAPVGASLRYNNIGRIALFYCNVGNQLQLEAEIRCLDNGQWSHPLPKCLGVKKCKGLIAPVGASLRYNNNGRNAIVFCNVEYQLQGQAEIRCLDNGQWSHPLPKCLEKYCKRPIYSKSVNMISTQSKNYYPLEAKITFKCRNKNMKIRGQKTITCVGMNAWDSDLPSCGCPKLQITSNLRVVLNKDETAANFGCVVGFTIYGRSSTKCLANGRWSYPVPICEARKCVIDGFLLQNDVYIKDHEDALDEVSFSVGEKATLTCDGKTVAILTCLKDSTWSEEYDGISCNVQRKFEFSLPSFSTSSPTTIVTIPPPKEPKKVDFSSCGIAGDVNGVDRLIFNRVLGGTSAKTGAWPWQVLVLSWRPTVGSSFDNVKGGASIINERWLLSAAHVYEPEQRDDSKSFHTNFVFTMGITEIPHDMDEFSGDEIFYAADRIILHSGYSLLKMTNDISLIKVGKRLHIRGSKFVSGLSQPIAFGNLIRTICLPCITNCKNSKILTSSKPNSATCNSKKLKEIGESFKHSKTDFANFSPAVVTGFGHTSKRNPTDFDDPIISSELQQAALKLHNATHCADTTKKMKKTWIGTPQYATGMFCASNTISGRRVDACQGDSGGPIVRKVQSNSGQSCWYQIGIVSWGLGCGAKVNDVVYPGFYTDVAHFVPWILKNIKENS